MRLSIVPRRKADFSTCLLTVVFAATAGASNDQEPPAYAVLGARIASGGEITTGTLVLRGGRIAGVHPGDLEAPADAIALDGSGWTLYPGFIDPHTELGMPELERPPRGSFTELVRTIAERRPAR